MSILQVSDELVGAGGAEPLDGGQGSNPTSFEGVADGGRNRQRPLGSP